MPYPKYTMKARFFYGRVRHIFDHHQFGLYPPHKAICEATGAIKYDGGHDKNPDRKTCAACLAIQELHLQLEMKTTMLTWLRLKYGRYDHAFRDPLPEHSKDAIMALCGAIGTRGRASQKTHERCPLCQTIIEAATPGKETG